MTHEEYVQGLRDMADFVERTPDFPLDCTANFNIFPGWGHDDSEIKSEMARYARMLAPVEKDTLLGEWFILRRKFGPVTIEVNAKRDKVCTPKVVRVEHVPEQVIPERVIPAHDTEVIECDCEPLLK